LGEGDWLEYYARTFPTVEVNTTFYRTPPRGLVSGWIEKARRAPGFEFSLKAPQRLTQDLLASGTVVDVSQYAIEWRALVPDRLRDAGCLGAVLLQLAPNVHQNAATAGRLDAALRALDGLPAAVELRHASWLIEDSTLPRDVLELLDAHDAAIVLTDGPGFPDVQAGGASHAYARFHGRNPDLWYGQKPPPGDPRLNRYDYRYARDELQPWAARLASLSKRARDLRNPS
jgi:uncharacterized protein YecE (DUF72 family)